MVDAVQRLTLPMLMQIVKQANERFFFFQAGRQLADQRCATMSAVTSVHTSAKVGWHDAQAGRQLADQRCLCVQGLHTPTILALTSVLRPRSAGIALVG